jgi:hypothetical protein
MFEGLRSWWALRRKRNYEKYVAQRGWLDEKTLDRLRQQQSPLRRSRKRL